MNLDLESSSSSDIDNVSPPRLVEAASSFIDDDENSDHDVDESLVQSLRSALHFAVGNICKQQDSITLHDTYHEDTAKSPSFAMSPSAIASLTDLAFHYSTTLLANDAVAFSSHAGRKAVKAEDVMLMARKDKRGIGAELKRKLKEMQARGDKSARGGGNHPEKGKKKSGVGKRSVSPPGRARMNLTTNPHRVEKAFGGTFEKSKISTGRGDDKRKIKSVALDSSSEDEGDALLLMQQRVKSIERAKSSNSHVDREDGTDLNDFIVDDNEYFHGNSGSEAEFLLDSATTMKKGTTQRKSKEKSKVALFNSSKKAASKPTRRKDMFRDLSDSDSSGSIGKAKSQRADGSTEAMAIDLESD